MSEVDDPLGRILDVYLNAGMPARHGMSTEEYIETCRRLWDECPTDEQFPRKILIDRLFQETAGHRFFNLPQYVDPRARAAVDVVERPVEPLYCLATGEIPLSQYLRGDFDFSPEPVRPDTPETDDDFDLWVMAVLDVLGFEQMYHRLGPSKMQAIYNRLIERARSTTETTAVGMSSVKYGSGSSPTVFHFTLGFSYFSDTLLLWAPLTPNHVSPFLARCADIIGEALEMGILLRGAVAAGQALLDKKNGLFLGEPLIEAARLEHAQDWAGVALAGSCLRLVNFIDSGLVLPYTPPCKPDTPLLHSGLVLDWPRRVRNLGARDPAAELDRLNTSPAHRKYYDNTITFVEHSARHSTWNRDKRVPIVMGAVHRAIFRSALDGRELPDPIDGILRSLQETNPDGPVLTETLRGLAQGRELPPDICDLPASAREMLESLHRVVRGEVHNIEEIVLAALEARLHIRELPQRHKEALEALPTEKNEMWQSCIPFIRALAAGDTLPQLPHGLPTGVIEPLEMAIRAVAGEVPPIDMETLFAGVFWASATATRLGDDDLKRLAALQEMEVPWNEVAAFLAEVGEGREVDADPSRVHPGAWRTIKGVLDVLAWQRALRRSVPEACATISGRMISQEQFGNLLRELSSDPQGVSPEADAFLTQLESAGSPHDAVARYIRRLRTGGTGEFPGGVPEDALIYLRLASAIYAQTEVAFPFEHLVAVAIRARLTGDFSVYEDAVFRFFETSGGTEGGLASELLRIAEGGPESAADERLDEQIRDHLTRLIGMVDQPLKSMATLKETGAAALRARRDEGAFEPRHRAFLEVISTMDDAKAAVSAFLQRLAEPAPGPIPEVPANLPSESAEYLHELRVLAILGRDFVDLHGLANATVSVRVHGDEFTQEHKEVLAAFTESGEPYSRVAEFLSELAIPGTAPRLPHDLRPELFRELASARREAYTLDRTVIGVARVGTRVVPTTA